MKASIIYLLSKHSQKCLLVLAVVLLNLFAGAQSRQIGYASYDYVSGVWYQVDSMKVDWLDGFGGDFDHPLTNGDWNVTYRETINRNYSSINYGSQNYYTYNSNNQRI